MEKVREYVVAPNLTPSPQGIACHKPIPLGHERDRPSQETPEHSQSCELASSAYMDRRRRAVIDTDATPGKEAMYAMLCYAPWFADTALAD